MATQAEPAGRDRARAVAPPCRDASERDPDASERTDHRYQASEQKDEGSARITGPPGPTRVGEELEHEQHGAAAARPP